ncbi:MAG: ATP-binding protein [Cyanobacteriota bacterium]|nr:ATP-binding protein [Cyanobacteriota bacterium]
MAMEALVLPGTLDALDPIADYIKMAAQEAGLDSRATYRLRLAVDEIATNIITHGYAEAGCEGNIEIAAILDAKSLTIHLEDTGITYDPSRAIATEEETILKPLADRPIGGLGVYLAIQGVNRFIYEREGNRNRNIFVVYRDPA